MTEEVLWFGKVLYEEANRDGPFNAVVPALYDPRLLFWYD